MRENTDKGKGIMINQDKMIKKKIIKRINKNKETNKNKNKEKI